MTPNHAGASEDRQRRVSQAVGFAVGMSLAAAVGFCLVLTLSFGPREQPDRLEATINPNTACVASLTRLPGIGPVRARAIVAFRKRHWQETGEAVAFHGPGDLQRIRGVGPKTVAGMVCWLQFE